MNQPFLVVPGSNPAPIVLLDSTPACKTIAAVSPPSRVKLFRWLRSVALSLVLVTALANGQTSFTVPGISGLSFHDADSSYALAVADSFSIHGLRIFTDALTLKYDKPTGNFSIFGSAKAVVEDTALIVGFGDAHDPGLVIASRTLTSARFLVTGALKIKGVSFLPDSLWFSLKSDSTFAVSGSSAVALAGDTINMKAGSVADPGMIFERGKLKTLRLQANGKFSIKSLTLVPDSVGFVWRSADTSFAMNGSLSVLVGTDSIKVSAGTQSSPGIVYSGGVLKKIELSAGGKFSIKSVTIIPDSLGIKVAADTGFSMYGSLAVAVGGDTIKMKAGSIGDPGMVFERGQLKKLRLLASAKFNIKSLTLNPDSLGFVWRSADTSFAMNGSLSLLAGTDSIKVSAGTEAKPGIVYSGGVLKKIDLSIGGKFSIKSVTIIPDSLGIKVAADTGFSMYGSLSVAVAGDTMNMKAGSVSDPGIVFEHGSLKKLQVLALGKFSIKSTMFISDSVGFVWRSADTSFVMHGSLSLLAGTDSIKVSAGTSSLPGIVYSGGVLKKIELSAGGKFSVKSLTIIPDSLGIKVTADTGFSMYGSLAVAVAGDTIKMKAGSVADPGLVFERGQLKKLQLLARGKFSIKSLTFVPDSLGFAWKSADTSFAMNGSLSFLIGTDSIKVSAGTESSPGIVYSGGVLKKIELSAGGRFSIKSVTIIPDSLGIKVAADTGFSMYGTLSVAVAGDTIKMKAGSVTDPGMVFDHGTLKKLQLLASGKFSIKSLTLLPDSLSFIWRSVDTSFAMNGSLSVAIAGDTMKMKAGSLADPGIVYTGGALKKLQLLALGKFSIKSTTFISDSVGFLWRSADTSFVMHGSLSLIAGTDSIKVSAGTQSSPGIVYAGGVLKKIELSAGGKFSIKSLTIIPDSLGIKVAADTGFSMYGSLAVAVAGDTIKMRAGSVTDPGMVFERGQLKKLQLLARGKFSIKSLTFIPDSLGFDWRSADTSFAMNGSLSFLIGTDSIKVSAGTQSSPGIVYAGGVLKKIELSVGGKFSIKSVTIVPDSLGIKVAADTGFSMYGSLAVIASSDTIKMKAGNFTDPGMVFERGQIKKLRLLASAKFSIKSLTLIPDSLEFVWRTADTSYVLDGSLSVAIAGDTMKMKAGSIADPGIIYTGGALKKLQLLALGKFSIKSTTFISDSVGFVWRSADTSFVMHGSLSLLAGTDSIRVSAGTPSSPGIVYSGGVLKKIELSAGGKFSIKSLTIIPDSLGIKVAADTGFSMFGSLAVAVGGDTIKMRAGRLADPGVVFERGQLKTLRLQASGKFNIKSLTFIPDSLGFVWRSADTSFAMSGSLAFLIGTDSIKVSAGTESLPGIVYSGGVLKKIELSAGGKFSIKSVTIIPDSLGIKVAADTGFSMYGSLSVAVAGDTIKMKAGSASDPGMVIERGQLKKLRFLASAKFNIKSLTLIPDSVGFVWRSADTSFAMSGALSLLAGTDSIRVSAGTEVKPGIVYTGGALRKIELNVGGKFSVKSVTIIPDSLGITVAADTGFSMYGSLAVAVAGDTIKMRAGRLSDPGMVFERGQLKKLRLLASGKFSIKSLTFIPDSLGFNWRSADTSFAMNGSLSFLVGTDSIKVSAGTEAKPGIVYAGGVLKKIDLSAGGKFSVKSVTIVPDSLGIKVAADTGFSMFGSLSVIVSSDTIRMKAGNVSDPGMVIERGQLKKLRFLASGKFNIKNLAFIPDSLGFVWRTADTSFAMSGSLSFIVGTDSVKVSAGNETSPGIVVAGGVLKKLDLNATARFNFKGITVAPQGAGFRWVSDSVNMFAMYGSITVNVNNSDFRASFGTSAQPGFVIVNGVVKQWRVSLSDTLKLSGLSLALKSASLEYDSGKRTFSIWGDATVMVGSDTVRLFLGTSAFPGLGMLDGRVVSVNAGVTTSFKVGGLTLSPNQLTFAWNDTTHTVKIYGSISAIFDGKTTTFFAGTKDQPGIMLVNGAVKSLSLGVTGDLQISSLVLKPRGLSFAWADSGYFRLYGSATAMLGADSISAMLGDITNPGMLISGGSLERLNVGITANFKISSLQIQPRALTFRYEKPTARFVLFGGILVRLSSDSIAAMLGDSASPGIVYSNGTVKQVHIGVSAGLSLKGLSFRTDSLSLVWASDSSYFKLYGGARITVGPDTIGCDFGTSAKPGLIIKNGVLTYLSLNVNSNLKIGNLEIKTQDLDLTYQNSIYTLTGTCSISQVFSVSVTLGAGGTPGVILDVSGQTPHFRVENLVLQIAHANLGSVDLKNFMISIQDGTVRKSTVRLAFPGGWEVGAGIAFKGTPARIDSIGVDWAATSIQSAIALPNGMLIAGMQGSLKNLANPSGLTFEGQVLLLYGGPVTIKQPGSGTEREGALLCLNTFARINKSGITLGAKALVGAYRVDANWYSTLGEGNVTLSVLWGKYAMLTGNFKIPTDPMVEIAPLVYLDARRNFDAMLDVTFYVPGFVPWIHGQKIGNAAGAMRYRYNDLNHSYAAAWVNVDAWLFRATVGAQYNFGSRSMGLIGGGDVSQIRRDIKDHTPTSLASGDGLAKVTGRRVRSIINSFTTLSPAPSLLLVTLQWPSKVDSTVVTVLGPEGTYELTRVERAKGDSVAAFLRSPKIERDFALVSGDSLATFIVAPSASFTSDTSVAALLPPGQYQVVCTSHNTGFDTVGLKVMPMYKPAKSDVWVSEGSKVNVKFSSMQTESTYVDLYVSDSPSYSSGRLVKQIDRSVVGKDGTALVDTLFQYSTTDPWVGKSDSLWCYAVIDDRLNPPSFSKIAGPFILPPALRGKISVTEGVDSVTAGLLVFVDDDKDGSWDVPGTGHLEIHGVTDTLGEFRIPALPRGTHQLRIIAPPEYTLLSNNQPVEILPIEYNGAPLELKLKLQPNRGVPK